MAIFPKDQKDAMLEAFDSLFVLFPAIEKDDPDFSAELFDKMRKIVIEYDGFLSGEFAFRLRGDSFEFMRCAPKSKATLISSDDISRVIFNDQATIVVWADGDKTVVKCQPEDADRYSPEAGVALAVMKKALGNQSNFNNVLRRLVKEAK